MGSEIFANLKINTQNSIDIPVKLLDDCRDYFVPIHSKAIKLKTNSW